MTTRGNRRRPEPKPLPTGPTALVIADDIEAAALEPLFVSARVRATLRLVGGERFDLEEYMMDLEEALAGSLSAVSFVLLAADRLVDARIDIINLLDELLDQRRPLLVSCTQATLIEQTMLCQHPGRVVGVGIVGVLGGANVVEVAYAPRTNRRFVEQTLAFFRQAGAVTEIVPDIPGLVLARLLAPVINEAALALSEHAASPEDIDATLHATGRLPFAPLHWADDLGLDRVIMVLEHLSQSLDGERFRPAPLLRQLALSGYTGRSAGRGFFTYAPAAP